MRQSCSTALEHKEDKGKAWSIGLMRGAMPMQTTRRCIIQIDMRYPKSLTETLTDDTTSTEVALESEVSPLLAELFGGVVLIEEIKIRHVPSQSERDGYSEHG